MYKVGRYKYRTGYVMSLDACDRYLTAGHNIASQVHITRAIQPERCDERRLLDCAVDRRWGVSNHIQWKFRSLRSEAPPEVRVRLVLPHMFARAMEHETLGEYRWEYLFIPTGSGGPALWPHAEPTERDRERLQTFIDMANGLLKDDVTHAECGFAPSDFTFEVVPEATLKDTILPREEILELAQAGPEGMELYGLTARQFVQPYLPDEPHRRNPPRS